MNAATALPFHAEVRAAVAACLRTIRIPGPGGTAEVNAVAALPLHAEVRGARGASPFAPRRRGFAHLAGE